MTTRNVELRKRLTEWAVEIGRGPAAVGGSCLCDGLFLAYTEPAALFHTQPTCKDFDELEADEYLRKIRIARSD